MNKDNKTTGTDAYLQEVASASFQFCTLNFGVPDDASIPYVVWRGPQTLCAYQWLLRKYIVQINYEIDSPEQICASMSHEMYHRFTMRRKGVHRELWLNEILAFLTSQWFLRAQRFCDYAEYIERMRVARTKTVSVSFLKSAQKKKDVVSRLAGNAYTSTFGEQIQRFAIDLHAVVGKEHLVKLVGAVSLDSWLNLLPENLRSPVSDLLNQN